MKTGHSAACLSAVIPLVLFCHSVKEKPKPPIDLSDYLGLRVGNSWEYAVAKYELTGTPESNYQFTSMDSIIRTRSITSHLDSTWYYRIKDSLFFRWNCREPNGGYLDTPAVTVRDDTCVLRSTGLEFDCCGDGGFIYDTMSHQWADSVSEDGNTISYFWQRRGDPNVNNYYVKKIGWIMQWYETIENSKGRGEMMLLIKFNGVANNAARLVSNHQINESYTFRQPAPQ